MFGFMKKKQSQPVIASVTYLVTKDDTNRPVVRINLHMDGYNGAAASGISAILKTLATGTAFQETLIMLKNGLDKDGQQPLMQAITDDLQLTLMEIVNTAVSDDEPCVQPTDLF